MNQLWLLVWFESNKMLEFKHSITIDYMRSLNGIFNETITYRSDSFVPDTFYGSNCHYIPTRTQDNLKNWKEYEKAVIAKPR